MNPQLQASLRALVEQILQERGVVTKSEVQGVVAQAVAAALDLGSSSSPDPKIIPTSIPLPQASEPKKNGRKPKQSEEERKAKRAKYQRGYRARQKDKELAASGISPPSKPVPPAPVRPVMPAKKETNGAGPAPIAYVPAVDLGDV